MSTLSQRIVDLAAEIVRDNPGMNPITAVFMAMQTLDPKPGATMVVDFVSHAVKIGGK